GWALQLKLQHKLNLTKRESSKTCGGATDNFGYGSRKRTDSDAATSQ
ncbi:3677_t:CDS:2, partial [Paraglomus occultum]